MEGRYPAGERLPTDDLRVEFGVSKQPVMEALRRLSSDGMVEIVPQVGCRVTRYELQEVEDFYVSSAASRAPSPGSPRCGAPTTARRARRHLRADRRTARRARPGGPVARLPGVEPAVP